jgi:hypothetical protein
VIDAAPKSSDERRALLGCQLQRLVAQGRRIESQSDHNAVLVRGHGIFERREAVSIDVLGTCLIERFGFDVEPILIAAAGVLVLATILAIMLVAE